MSDLLTRKVFVVNQKAKLVGLADEYRVRDEEGTDIGYIREESQPAPKKPARRGTQADQVSCRLSLYDRAGTKVVELVRPRRIARSRAEISDGDGRPLGRIVQQYVFGKTRFGLEGASGELLGSISAENWGAWDFAIQDATGAEVGRITKKWPGLLQAGFTPADNYVLEIGGQVSDDLRLMMVASAAGADVALRQDGA